MPSNCSLNHVALIRSMYVLFKWNTIDPLYYLFNIYQKTASLSTTGDV